MLRFLNSKDPWRVVVHEDFSDSEPATVVNSVSPEFLCSEGLEAGQEQTVVEAELFSRLCWMAPCVGTSWISFGSKVQTWLGLFSLDVALKQESICNTWIILTKKPPNNLRSQVLIIKGNIALFSSQHIPTPLLFFVPFSFFFSPPPTSTQHQQMVQTSVYFASVSSLVFFLFFLLCNLFFSD